MADAYGTLTLSKSENCIYDLANLQAALNKLSWDSEGGSWEMCSESAELVFSQSRVQYPTVYPSAEDAYIFISAEGDRRYEKAPSEMVEDDWDCYYDVRTREISLEEISALIMPFVEQGWIEIAYSSSEKCRYVEFGLLRLDRDGKSYRRLNRSGPFVEPLDSWEQI